MRVRAVLPAALLLAAHAAAQDPGPAVRSVQTADGSRFVLVPTSGPPVVHWVVASRSGPLADPPGLEGLAHAVTAASLSGTGSLGSLDPERERAALAEEETLEARLAAARGQAGTQAEAAAAQLARARAEAEALGDPLAFERALRAAPASGATVSRLPQATLVEVVATLDGLPRVAELLLARREDAVLRGWRERLAATRRELGAARAVSPLGAAHEELLRLAFQEHPYRRFLPAAESLREPTRAEAVALYRRVQAPPRTLHVLVGGFDVPAVEAMLQRVFDRTGLWKDEAETAPRAHPGAREGLIRTGNGGGVLVAHFLPAPPAPASLLPLATWLGDPDEGHVVSALRAQGHPQARVQAWLPYPDWDGGTLLLEVFDPRVRSDQDTRVLAAKIAQLLDEAGTQPPDAAALERTHSALRAARTRAFAANGPLAVHLATALFVEGRAAEDVLRGDPRLDAAGLQRTAAGLFDRERRIVLRVLAARPTERGR
ncbi:MAG: insulinase family protein [Planctomycetes bacterium]|nr:insulinase family protein [Planctomycetota bacterium]